MNRRQEIAQKLSHIMPHIARALTASLMQMENLSPTQIFALLALEERRSCHFSVLCQDLHVAAPTVTGIIDRLEKGGFVKRIPDEVDRRAINLVLTAKGLRTTKDIRAGIVQRWEIILEKIPIVDCEKYLQIVSKILDKIEAPGSFQINDDENSQK